MAADPLGLAPGVAYDLAWSFAALAATLGCVAALAAAAPEHRLRWWLWTVAVASWLLAQLVWDLYGLVGFARDPNLADVGWWAFALFVMVSVLPSRRTGRGQLAIALAEVAPLICAALGLCLSLLWQTATHSAVLGAARVSDLVYPCLYVSAAILTLQAMLGGGLGGVRSRATGLFLFGTATISFAFIMWSQELLRSDYVPGTSLLDPLWVIGLGLISLGALTAARRPEPTATDPGPAVSGVVLPAGMFLLLIGALLTETLFGASPVAKQILVLSLLCSGCALIVRSTLLSWRVRGMLIREQATSAALLQRETELARLNRQLVEDSRHDPLTGIGNRRALAEDLPMFLSRQREAGEPVAVLLCDVDHFKAYNDT
ncbi:MAG TPA: GGDEF domain-containing protein, partial [Solirubrobacteraceae bacterium]|nr:GGDEF domain-containing protein [Solirubrobacteraceae bacterium]